MASKPHFPIFQRLAGLETEYAIRFSAADSFARPTSYQLYRKLVSALRKQVKTATAKTSKIGVFTANGGAVWYESERLTTEGGLVEGSTPECRGPLQVMLYQRAQDHVLSEAAGNATKQGTMRLLKNCRDSEDNVYGAQENYQAVLAEGWRLVFWKIGLVLLFPLATITWLSFWSVVLTYGLFLILAAIFYFSLKPWLKDSYSLGVALFGRDIMDSQDAGNPIPPWAELALMWFVRIIVTPVGAALFLLINATTFHAARRGLLPFLVSRSVICGSGMLDRKNRFHLADKAPAINCVCGCGGLFWDRPLFNYGHFFKMMTLEGSFPVNYFNLFTRIDRLQIGLGDSNMADTSEYLRIGTTMLVLDAIEAGHLKDIPRVSRPIRSMHKICGDPTLQTKVRTSRGQLTALEIQRHYLQQCCAFLESTDDVPEEAWKVWHLWKQTLDDLEHSPRSTVGAVDWVTKQFLIEKCGQNASWEQRKKVDLRYHELSDDGYFQQIKRTELYTPLLDPSEIAQAVRCAPSSTPAAIRSRFIREFATSGKKIAVNWQCVVIGSGRNKKVIPLDDASTV